ncbi:hypothetical protein ACFB49_08740 [Sphingomonas sp. DBB INV C78]
MRMLAFALAGGVGCVAHAQPTQLAVASALEPGLWQLQAEGEAPRKICVGPDTGALVQVRHAGTACSRLVIANQKSSATVHYSCPGAGWGRTTVKMVTPRSVTLDTQGIAANAPFAFTADARRMGDCPTKSASLNRANLPR